MSARASGGLRDNGDFRMRVNSGLEKLGPANQPPRRGLNPAGQPNGTRNSSGNHPVEMSLFAANQLAHLPKGQSSLPDSVSEIAHVPNFVVELQNWQEVPNVVSQNCHNTTRMDRWPLRANFVKRLEQYRERTGATIAEVAKLLGVSESSVYSYCSRETSQPSENTKKAAAKLFGCPITEFIDDPGSPPPGIDPERWAEASERSRVLASAMFEDLTKFPEEEQEEYYKLWQQGVRIGLARRAAEAKEAEKKPGGRGGKKP